MDNSLVVALGITVVGMTLLFLALIFFYGLLTVLTALFKERRPAAKEGQEQDGPGADAEGALLRAAAVAVALARAEAELEVSAAPSKAREGRLPAPATSPWWHLHHQRQLARNAGSWRTR